MKPMKISFLIAIAVSLGWHTSAQTYDTNGDYVQTLAGSGLYGYVDGIGQLTMFNGPSQIVSDTSSNLFIWDSGNHRIRKIAPDGTVSTFAGGGNQIIGVGTNVNLSITVGGMTIDRNDTPPFLSS